MQILFSLPFYFFNPHVKPSQLKHGISSFVLNSRIAV